MKPSKKGKAKPFAVNKIEWEPFDDFGGYNPQGPHAALIINGVEVYDFWADGRVTCPIGSPAEARRRYPKWRIGRGGRPR
jgi:hypothetical protein